MLNNGEMNWKDMQLYNDEDKETIVYEIEKELE